MDAIYGKNAYNMRGSRNFRQVGGGGGGGPGQSDKKKALTTFFFFFCFFCFVFSVLSLFYRSQMVNFKENYHFSRFQGGPTFSRGGGGVQLLIPYRNPYIL